MSPEAQRNAIAGRDGWTIEDIGSGKAWHKDGILAWEAPPDYLNDLNAARAVVMMLPEVLPGHEVSSNPAHYPRWAYVGHLARAVGIKLFDNGEYLGRPNPQDLFKYINASAAQMMEAYLKALHLWADENNS